MKININGHLIELNEDQLKQDVVELKDENIVLLQKVDFDTRIKNESDSGYARGKIAGEEMTIKAFRDKFSVDVEGKDFSKITDAIKSKILKEANIEPSKQIEERDKTIDQLRKNIGLLESEKTDLANQFKAKETKMKLDSMLFSAIPDKAVSDSFTKNDIAAMFRGNGYDISEHEGKIVVLKNGEIQKHETTLEPLKYNDVINQFVLDKKLIKTDGRGAGDSAAKHNPGSIDAFDKEMEDRGIKYGTNEYYKEMSSRVKDGSLKY